MSFHWETMIISAIAFLILYWLLDRYALKSLFLVMEERKARVLGEMEQAKNTRLEVDKALEHSRAALKQAQQEAKEIIEQAKSLGNRQAEETLTQAKAEAVNLKDQALAEIQGEKQKAIAALRTQVSGMSVLIASKIIEKQLDEKSHEELIQQYLKEAGTKHERS